MVIDIELTLNRFGFGKIAENKFQLFCFRFSKWQILNKHSISFEINWRKEGKVSPTEVTKQDTAKTAQNTLKNGVQNRGTQPSHAKSGD